MNSNGSNDPQAEREARLTALLLGELSNEEAAATRLAIEQDAELSLLHDQLKRAIELVQEASASSVTENVAPSAKLQLAADRREKLLQQFKTVCPPEFATAQRRDNSWALLMGLAAALVALIGSLAILPGFWNLRDSASDGPRRSEEEARWGLVTVHDSFAKEVSPAASVGKADRYRAMDQPIAGATPSAASPRTEIILPTAGEPASARSALERTTALPIQFQAEENGVVLAEAARQPEQLFDRTYRVDPNAFVDRLADADFSKQTQGGGFGGGGGGGLGGGRLGRGAMTEEGASFAFPRADLGAGSTSGGIVGATGIAGTGGGGGGFGRGGRGLAAPPNFDVAATPQEPSGPVVAGAPVQANSGNRSTTHYYSISPSAPAEGRNDFGDLSTLSLGKTVDEKKQESELRPTDTAALSQDAAAGSAAGDLFSKSRVEDLVAAGDGRLGLQGGTPPSGALDGRDAALRDLQRKPDVAAQIVAGATLGQPLRAEESGPAPAQLPAASVPRMEPQLMRRYGLMPPSSASAPDGLAPYSRSGTPSAEPARSSGNVAATQELQQLGALTQRGQITELASPLDKAQKEAAVPEISAISRQTEVGGEEIRISNANRGIVEALSLQREAKLTASTEKKSGARSEASSRGAIEPEPANAATRPARPSAPAPASAPQPEVLTSTNAFSTFSLNVSDVSFRLAAASLEKGVMPEPGSVRSEEFINAFDYRDSEPPVGAPLGFAWERARYPFAHGRDVLRLSIKTAAVGRQSGRPLNLVLLLDNSGSMERADRAQIIREALRVLAAQLQPQDKISIVAFARTARLIVDGVSGSEAVRVIEQAANLTPDGGTNLESALDLAYSVALRHYAGNGDNRIALLTDGAANLGNVEPAALQSKVDLHRRKGIALDCFGVGWEGFNDDLLEVLSRNGDGRYAFLNSSEEAATEFVGKLAGALRVAASDVKVQVEFNARRVTAYRQIGYARHQLTKEQFRDNKVDAAEIAAAESGNALYVIQVNPNGQGPLGIARARFKIPGTSEYREHQWEIPYTGHAVALEQAAPAMRLAATASAFSEWLASSPYAAEVTPDQLLAQLSGVAESYGPDPRPRKLEWMIRQAKSIAGP